MRTAAVFAAAGLVVTAIMLGACGGGGGGSLSPPTYNVDGTWSVVETVGQNNGGIPTGTQLHYSIVMNHAPNSNTVTMRDTRAAIGDTGTATISGTSLTYSGERYPEFGCQSMVGTYNLTVSGAGGTGTSMSGNGSVTCQDDGKSGQTTVSATKQ